MRYEKSPYATFIPIAFALILLVLLAICVTLTGCGFLQSPEGQQTVRDVAPLAGEVVRDAASGNWFGVAEGVLTGLAAIAALVGGNEIRKRRKKNGSEA